MIRWIKLFLTVVLGISLFVLLVYVPLVLTVDNVSELTFKKRVYSTQTYRNLENSGKETK